jgi:hypothetical protein
MYSQTLHVRKKKRKKKKHKNKKNKNLSSFPCHLRTYPTDDLILTIDMDSATANVRATQLPTYQPTLTYTRTDSSN